MIFKIKHSLGNLVKSIKLPRAVWARARTVFSIQQQNEERTNYVCHSFGKS